MSTECGESGLLRPAPGFSEEAFRVSQLSVTLAVGLSDVAVTMLRCVSSEPTLVKVFFFFFFLFGFSLGRSHAAYGGSQGGG